MNTVMKDTNIKGFGIREANEKDLDSLTELVIAAMDDDPSWNYRYCHRQAHMTDHVTHTKEKVRSFLKPSKKGRFVVKVIVTTKDHEHEKPGKIVSFAVWFYPKEEGRASSDKSGPCTRSDADPRRVAAFKEALEHAQTTIIDPKYGVKRAHLQYIGTDPDFREKRLTAELLGEDIEKIKAEGLVVTAFSSCVHLPGRKYYAFRRVVEKYGLGIIHNVQVQVEGEDQKIDVAVLGPKEHARAQIAFTVVSNAN